MQNTDKRRAGVQSIARAGAVLRALEPHPEGLGLIELARLVELPKSTVHRLVGALTEEELLSSRAGGRIVLGGALARLGAANSLGLREELLPLLQELRERVDETVDLAVLEAGQMRFVEQLPAGHRLRAVSAVGARFPLHCTANGKAMLAALGPQRTLELLPVRLARCTRRTIVSRTRLAEQLEQIRRDGFAVDREEHTLGISAVGASVIGSVGPLAAISVPVPTARFTGRESVYAKAVAKAARAASERLAGMPQLPPSAR